MDGIAANLAQRISDGIPVLVDGDSDRSLSDANIGSLLAIPFKIRKKLFGMLLAIAGQRIAPLH